MRIKCLNLSLMLISGSMLSLVGYGKVFPYQPRMSIIGSGGSHSAWEGDVLIPVLGDNDQLWYGNIQGRYGANDSWSGGLGLGYRRIISQAIWGGYVLVDRNDTGTGPTFTSISSGLERLDIATLSRYIILLIYNWSLWIFGI